MVFSTSKHIYAALLIKVRSTIQIKIIMHIYFLFHARVSCFSAVFMFIKKAKFEKLLNSRDSVYIKTMDIFTNIIKGMNDGRNGSDITCTGFNC